MKVFEVVVALLQTSCSSGAEEGEEELDWTELGWAQVLPPER